MCIRGRWRTRLRSVIEKYGEKIVSGPTDEILPDMKELPFYEVVVENKCNH